MGCLRGVERNVYPERLQIWRVERWIALPKQRSPPPCCSRRRDSGLMARRLPSSGRPPPRVPAPANRLALLPSNALFRATPSGLIPVMKGRGMTNTRKILVVDDDSELREALIEQLALLEEFESIAVDQWNQGRTDRQGRSDRSRDHGCRASRRRRARSRTYSAQERLQGADHHVDWAQYRFRHHPRARVRCQRLRDQAFSLCRAACAHSRAPARPRGERGRRLHHWPLHVPAELETPAQSRG